MFVQLGVLCVPKSFSRPLYVFFEVRTDVDFDRTEALVTSYELICHFTSSCYSKCVILLSTTIPVLAIPPPHDTKLFM